MIKKNENNGKVEKFIRRDSDFSERRSINDNSPWGGIQKQTNITLTKTETGEVKPKNEKE